MLAAGDKRLVAVLVGGEMAIYIAYKLLRGDFFYWIRLDGALAIVGSSVVRFLVKIVADYTGCLHFRHSYVGERANRENENDEARSEATII